MSGPNTPPAAVPPQASGGWDPVVERRLDEVARRLQEVVANLSDVTKDLRAQIRISDQQSNQLTRLEERLKDSEIELRDVPKRLERLATAEYMAKLDTRIGAIEDETRSPFVRKLEFAPVQKAVFTLIGAICLAVLGAVAKIALK